MGDETPLINASEPDYLDIVKHLVTKGADVNKSWRDGFFFNARLRTPLKMAQKNGHRDVEKYLIENGAENE